MAPPPRTRTPSVDVRSALLEAAAHLLEDSGPNALSVRRIAASARLDDFLVDEAAILCLPGEVFGPGLEGYLRLAFGNIREEAIPEAVRRFREMAA